MRDTGSSRSPEDDRERFDQTSQGIDPYDFDDEPSFDWIVFILRVSALLVLGATLITSVDLSRNQDVEWLTVMRLSILPFVGGMLLLAAAELIDRRGD